MFKSGEYVIYGSGEICCIEEITERCFDGINKIKYYKIAPKDIHLTDILYLCTNYFRNTQNFILLKQIWCTKYLKKYG